MRWALFLLCAAASAAPLSLTESRFELQGGDAPAGWRTWAPRQEIAPRTWIDDLRSRGDAGSLAVSGGSNPAAYGGWQRPVAGIEPGGWYRLTAWYRSEGLRTERQHVLARLGWQKAGKRAGWPTYAHRLEPDGEWTRVTVEARAPENADEALIDLFLAYAPQGVVWWDDVSLERIEAPETRRLKVASVNLRPRDTGSAAASINAFLGVIEREVPNDADLIVLPEGVTVVGTGKSYVEVAEPLPGPVTQKLGEAARSKNAYLVAGIYEREGETVYNTAVLLDRQGRLIGKYRKVYLPREEMEGGITPGDSYPVFDTDFGRVGMMICWDVQYADPARALALAGAEMILMPIWGGNETLAKARAIENHVFLVSSGYDHPTYIMDPKGELLATASEEGAVAVAEIDLNRRYEWPWLGEMRGRFFHEIRRDVPAEAGAGR